MARKKTVKKKKNVIIRKKKQKPKKPLQNKSGKRLKVKKILPKPAKADMKIDKKPGDRPFPTYSM